MQRSPRVAVLSRRRLERQVWQASQYEFEDVIAAVDDVHLVAPPGQDLPELAQLGHGAVNRLGRTWGRQRRSMMRAPSEVVDAELFFAVFAAPHEIGALPHVRAQLQRSRLKVAFIVEMYAPEVPGVADYLRQLRGFDHVFVFSRAVIPMVQQIAGVPCSFLAAGVDAERFTPPLEPPPRTIDVLSYGRRLQGTHSALLSAMAQGELYYSFDTVHGPFQVSSHLDHRTALATTLQRSRYSVVYKNNDEPGRPLRTGGEETLTNRYFETTAAGVVVLGTVPDTPDFGEHFAWSDAVVPIDAPAPDILRTIRALDQDPLRVAAARQAGVVAALRRHDWAYRWRHVLATVGLEEQRSLQTRLAGLAARADRHESAPVLP